MKRTVMSIGGSLVWIVLAVGEGERKEERIVIDKPYVEALKLPIEEDARKGDYFSLIVGGGPICRYIQNMANDIREQTDEEKDSLGIEVTKMNAFFMKQVFDPSLTYSLVVNNPNDDVPEDKRIAFHSGWRPGCSTDTDAALVAIKNGANRIINMSNAEKVYCSDPKINRDAKPYDEMRWKDFREMIGDIWKPGMNCPFDPIASKLAHESEIEVIVIGRDIANLRNVLDGKPYIGTRIY